MVDHGEFMTKSHINSPSPSSPPKKQQQKHKMLHYNLKCEP